MSNLDQKAEHIMTNFDFLESWEEKYQYIIDLGKGLPVMDESLKTPVNRVEGCMSQVWLHLENREGVAFLIADSDALIVRGLIALVRTIVQGQQIKDIQDFNFDQFFHKIGLDRQLSPNRRNGLIAFVQRVQKVS